MDFWDGNLVPAVGVEPTVWYADLQDPCNRRYATPAKMVGPGGIEPYPTGAL